MIEELEREFYTKLREVESMRKAATTKEARILVHQKEQELMKLEEDLECCYTLEDMGD